MKNTKKISAIPEPVYETGVPVPGRYSTSGINMKSVSKMNPGNSMRFRGLTKRQCQRIVSNVFNVAKRAGIGITTRRVPATGGLWTLRIWRTK